MDEMFMREKGTENVVWLSHFRSMLFMSGNMETKENHTITCEPKDVCLLFFFGFPCVQVDVGTRDRDYYFTLYTIGLKDRDFFMIR